MHTLLLCVLVLPAGACRSAPLIPAERREALPPVRPPEILQDTPANAPPAVEGPRSSVGPSDPGPTPASTPEDGLFFEEEREPASEADGRWIPPDLRGEDAEARAEPGSIDEALMVAARRTREAKLPALPPSSDGETFFGPSGPDESAPGAELGTDTPLASPGVRRAATRVVPGIYRGDPRFDALADRWPSLVNAAMRALVRDAGLAFPEGPAPVVILEPLRDEMRLHRVRTQIRDGVRRAAISVNAEPLVAGRVEPRVVLIHALAEGLFELVRLRHGPVPGWVAPMAASLAEGDLAAQVARVHRRVRLGMTDGALVDPDDPSRRRATGLAVRTLLITRGLGEQVPRLLLYAAEGDDAEILLQRLLREPGSQWLGPAREALASRFEGFDPQPWVLLVRARNALRDLGRAGLASVLPRTLPTPVRGELLLLRAQAAVAEGDHAAAREDLKALTAKDLARMRDPAEAMALHVTLEMRAEGDAREARRWMRRLDLDHPESPARLRLRRRHPLLGVEDDPLAWLGMIRRRMARHGHEHLGYDVLERALRVALLDHRPGAARELLRQIGDRARAPELQDVRSSLESIESEPGAAARAAQEARLERWLSGDPRAAQDVLDGGRLAFEALRARMVPRAGDRRVRLARMLVRLGGATATARTLARDWADLPALVPDDLQALAAEAPAPDAEEAVRSLVPSVLAHEQADRAWHRMRFALDDGWLATEPSILQRLHHARPATRIRALEQIVEETQPTPEVVGHLALDRVPALRRRAVEIAGEEGFQSLAQEGVRDEDPRVREAAALALSETSPGRALPWLLRLAVEDPAPAVRVTVARELARIAPREPDVVATLLRLHLDDSALVRDGAGKAMEGLPAVPLARALAVAVEMEAARETPRPAVVARWAVLYQRVSGRDPGHVPGAGTETWARLAARMRTWAREEAERIERDASADIRRGDR